MSTGSFLKDKRSLHVFFSVFQRNRQSTMYARVSVGPNLIKRRKWLISMSYHHVKQLEISCYSIKLCCLHLRHANQLVLDIEKAEDHGWDEEGSLLER